MVALNSKFVLLFAVAAIITHVQGAPFYKRIAQVIADSTQQWEQACDAAGGGDQCNPISVTAFSTLLAAAGPCDQQNSADAMIDLAKQLKSDANMIKFAQIFAQQPRNTPNALAVPYCQQAPKNSELNGLFQCQFQGANQQTFVGGLKVGSPGTIPFGLSSPVSPAGSCPANPAGPIADGSQLVDITQDPGLGNVGNGGSNGGGGGSSSYSMPSPTIAGAAVVSASAAGTDSPDSSALPSSTTSSAPEATATSSDPSSCSDGSDGSGDDSSDCVCSDDGSDGSGGSGGDDDCSSDGGDSDGGSGASGAPDGDGDDNGGAAPSATASPSATDSVDATATPTDTPATATDATPTATDPAATPTDFPSSTTDSSAPTATASASSSGDFKLQNGQDAQALNAKFATLTPDSACNEGDQACVNGGFAQCIGGKFAVIQCSSGLTCAALPLVNKPGTSIACDSQADILARIQATGAQGGITGN